MSKHHSIVELVATDKTRKNEYQMNTASFSNLPILHNYKQNNKCPMKLPNVINGFVIPFSLKKITFQNQISSYRYGTLQLFEY